MPGAVPDPVLAIARAASTASLDLSGIQIQRSTHTKDAYGTYSDSTAVVATVAGGWAKPSAAIMAAYAGVIGSLKSWVVRLPYGTSVRNGDLLLMPSGDNLYVQADLTERSYATCVRVLATEVK